MALAICWAMPAAALDVALRLDAKDETLRAALTEASLLTAFRTTESPAAQDILGAAKADYERLIGVLYRNAYYAPVIEIRLDGAEAAAIPLVSAPAAVRNASISIQTGPQFLFGDISIAPLPSGTELPEGFNSGAIAGVDVLKDTAEIAVEAWREEGYAKARISGQQITARHPAKALDAQIAVAPGPRLAFGNLVVSGNKDVRTERIIEIAGLPTGRVFSPEEISRASTRLQRTGTFRVAALSEAQAIGPGNTIDINAQITENLPRRYGIGAEVSSLEGFGLSGFWMHRNFLGGAERFRVEGEVSGIGGQSGGVDYRLGLRFDRPATFNEDTDFYLESTVERLDEVAFESDSFEVEAGITRYASVNREYTFGLGYRYSDVTDTFGTRSYSILTLPASATFDYRDNKLDAKSGYYAGLSLTPFANISGTRNGLRSFADLRAYHTFGSGENLTFAARAQIGSIVGPSLQNTPTDFLFYSGGGGTVRGQEYQSLSVDLGSGRVVGGRSFLGLSGELRRQLRDDLSIVGFYDAGYIGQESFPDGDSGDWHSGAGLGLRYQTGIGPIRLDIGVPISGPGTQSGVEVYIGIGQAF